MFDKVAIIGDLDLIYPLRALGIKVYSPKDVDEAKKVIGSLERENVALCFIHKSLLKPLIKEKEILREKFCPVVIGYSDFREVTDHIGQMMRDMAIKATGSDFIAKGRGKNEAG